MATTNLHITFEEALLKLKEYEEIKAKMAIHLEKDNERVKKYYAANLEARREYGRQYYKQKVASKAAAAAAC